MAILHRLKAKYHHRIEKKYIKSIKRNQFNTTISSHIIFGTKLLATLFQVPGYVITEHLLQVGTYHVLKVIEDPEKQEQLTEHMVKVHLLGTELSDDENILKLDED